MRSPVLRVTARKVKVSGLMPPCGKTTPGVPAPPHDGTGHTWHHDDDLLIEIITYGGMGNPEDFYPMPAFGDTLTGPEIEAVLAFIKTLWTDDQRAAQQARTDAVRGER